MGLAPPPPPPPPPPPMPGVPPMTGGGPPAPPPPPPAPSSGPGDGGTLSAAMLQNVELKSTKNIEKPAPIKDGRSELLSQIRLGKLYDTVY